MREPKPRQRYVCLWARSATNEHSACLTISEETAGDSFEAIETGIPNDNLDLAFRRLRAVAKSRRLPYAVDIKLQVDIARHNYNAEQSRRLLQVGSLFPLVSYPELRS